MFLRLNGDRSATLKPMSRAENAQIVTGVPSALGDRFPGHFHTCIGCLSHGRQAGVAWRTA
jgi:hypothetical protein